MIEKIYVDTREKPQAIVKILATFDRLGVNVIRQKLDEGDYMVSLDDTVTIDRKQNLSEICNNLTWDRERFKRELRRAQDKGKTLYILCEHGGAIKSLEDVRSWVNPRLKHSPKAVSGMQLHVMMLTFSGRYGVKWRFCDKRRTGKEILRILAEHPRGE